MKIFKLQTAIFCLFFTASASFAGHIPEINIDNDGKMVTIQIIHDVKDHEKHFIKEIEIFHNRKFSGTMETPHQYNKHRQSLSIGISDLKTGGKIQVKAAIGKTGSKSETYTVK